MDFLSRKGVMSSLGKNRTSNLSSPTMSSKERRRAEGSNVVPQTTRCFESNSAILEGCGVDVDLECRRHSRE